MYVLTLEQRRAAEEAAPALLRRLAGLGIAVPFRRTRAHAVQGLAAEPGDAVAVVLAGLRGGAWSVGVGVGPVRLGTATDARGRTGLLAEGPGTVHARRAAGIAAGGRVPVGVAAADGPAAARAQAVLRLLGRSVLERSDAEWRVVDLLVPGARGQQRAVAAELGITPQAVSKAVARSLWQEEWDARPAAALLLGLCEPAGAEPAGGPAHGSTTNPSATIHS